jgi:hypothetical protein
MPKCSFQVRVYKCMRGFHVPWRTARLLNVWSKDTVDLQIRRPKGKLVYRGLGRLTSGTEIRTGKAVRRLRRGETITVTIWSV